MAQGTLELKININGQEVVLKSVNDIKSAIADLQNKSNSLSIGSKEFKETNAQILNLNGSLKQASNAAANSGGAFKAFRAGIGEAAGGVSVFGTSLGALFKMLLTNPIGLIITAIVLLIQQLAKFESVTKPITAIVKGLGAAFEQLIKPIADAIGWLAEGAAKLVKFFGGAAKAAVEAVDLADQLEEAKSKALVTNAKLSAQEQELLVQSRDRTKSEEERIALIEKANQVATERLQNEIELAKKKKELADQELASVQETSNAYDEKFANQQQAEADLIKLQSDAVVLAESNQNRINALLDKSLDEEKSRQEEYKKLYEERRKAAIDAILAAQLHIRKINEQIYLDSITDEDERGREELRIKRAYEIEKVQAEIATLEAKKNLTKEEKTLLELKYEELKKVDAEYENKRVQFVKEREDEQADYIQTKALDTAEVQIKAQQTVTDATEEESEKRKKITAKEADYTLSLMLNLTDSLASLSETFTNNQLHNENLTEKERLAIAKKGFERQKKFQAAGTLIDAARGGISIWSDPTLLVAAKIAATVALAVQTAAALAKIESARFDSGGSSSSSSESPKGSTYATGGIPGGIFRGPSHAEGGIPIEVEGGEAIINKNSTAMYAGLLSLINQAGGGKSFDNGVQSTTTAPVMQTPVIKTYVVASEMTTQQEADEKYKRLARL
jgi:hypothetical protein